MAIGAPGAPDLSVELVTPPMWTQPSKKTMWRHATLVTVSLLFASLLVFLSTTQRGDVSTLESHQMKFMPDPRDAVNSAVQTVVQVSPFTDFAGSAKALDGKNWKVGIPKMLMEPQWASRSGREAAANALRQPFKVPLQKNDRAVPGAVSPLGEYAPKKPLYNNPLAQFIPNVTYWPNGDIVYDWKGPCKADDMECKQWKIRGYDSGAVVLGHRKIDRYGVPLAKFGLEAPKVLAGEDIERREEKDGVPSKVAEHDAERVLADEGEESGESKKRATQEAKEAIFDAAVAKAEMEDSLKRKKNHYKTKKEEEQAAKFLVHLFSKVKAEKAVREKEQQEERYLKHYVIKIEGRETGRHYKGPPDASSDEERVEEPSRGDLEDSFEERRPEKRGIEIVEDVSPVIDRSEDKESSVKYLQPSEDDEQVDPDEVYDEGGAMEGSEVPLRMRRAVMKRSPNMRGYVLKPFYTMTA
mmetsp:Transcript_8485/g.28441  ORF Transcript_8485/g.28441 Transcript_8485/m.28441 type:complete len:469 (-) Transcript_8485:58-1464(-)